MSKFFSIFFVLAGMSISLFAQELDPESIKQLFPDLDIDSDSIFSTEDLSDIGDEKKKDKEE